MKMVLWAQKIDDVSPIYQEKSIDYVSSLSFLVTGDNCFFSLLFKLVRDYFLSLWQTNF